jgi:hypothetical protein
MNEDRKGVGIEYSFNKDLSGKNGLALFQKIAGGIWRPLYGGSEVKTEDGSVGNITLRDYQKDILDLYDKNRFSILVGSRQIGKCNTFLTKIMLKDVGGITIGELYFKELSKIRNLTIFEKIKYFLYKLL